MYKKLVGPFGIELILNSAQVDFKDPGNGTPALVMYHGGSATYDCACDIGAVDRGDKSLQLPERSIKWLLQQQSEVDAIYKAAEQEQYPKTTIINVDGKLFQCPDCRATVFTQDEPLHFICNGCGSTWKGERE